MIIGETDELDKVYFVDESSLPVSSLERELTKIWSQVLNIEEDKIGVDNNFFDIGGDSLLLVKLYNLLEKLYPNKLTITGLFSNPNIRKLAELIENDNGKKIESIKINPIGIQKEYFYNNCHYQSIRNVFKFEANNELLDKLKKISCDEEISLRNILIAMYVYMLAEVSENNIIEIQTLTINEDFVVPLKISIDNIENISQLLNSVNDGFNNLEEVSVYKIKDIKEIHINKDNFCVIPFVYCKKLLMTNVQMSDFYDIILMIDEQSDKINFKFEFNSNKLIKEKVKELARKYLELIYLLTDEY